MDFKVKCIGCNTINNIKLSTSKLELLFNIELKCFKCNRILFIDWLKLKADKSLEKH